MSNEWYRNIPPQGVLVFDGDENIQLIVDMTVNYDLDGIAYNDAVSKSDDTFDIKHLRPLTAEEWWDFAPWQPMETAPLLEHILALKKADFENKDVVTMTMLHCDSQRNGYKKWLPLPMVD